MYRKPASNIDHFEEYFEESEGNLPNPNYEQVTLTRNPVSHQSYSQEQQIPIQLLKMKPNGEFEVNHDALELINSYNKPVGMVCLAGKYRTGKSFLLNKLLEIGGSGFRVDSSTSACTEGIWMWSKPMFNSKHDCYLFFIDTEGSQATNRNADHDAKIFTLGILLSSYFIYNSVGAIDEQSINQLNLVTTLSKRIVASEDENEDALHNYMPKFMWLLRDFVLEARNEQGDKLTAYEYLESCLLEQNSEIRLSEATKRVRRAMVNLFRDRDCMMLVRPAVSENQLKNLDTLPDRNLRSEFLQGIVSLRQKILNGAGPKVINGEAMSSLMLTQMIISYTNTINSDGVPNITSAWEHLGEQAALEAYDDALEAYNDKFEENFSVDEPKEGIHDILKAMRDEALDTFDCTIEVPNERVRNKLKNLIIDKEKAIVKINDQLHEARNVEILKDCSERLLKNVQQGKYSAQNPRGLTQDLNNAINEYNNKATGPKKCEVLSTFLTNFNPMVIKSYTETTRTKIASSVQNVRGANMTNDDNEDMIQTLQQRIRSMQQQLNTRSSVPNPQAQQAQSQLKQENEIMKKQIQILNSKNGSKCCLLF